MVPWLPGRAVFFLTSISCLGFLPWEFCALTICCYSVRLFVDFVQSGCCIYIFSVCSLSFHSAYVFWEQPTLQNLVRWWPLWLLSLHQYLSFGFHLFLHCLLCQGGHSLCKEFSGVPLFCSLESFVWGLFLEFGKVLQ